MLRQYTRQAAANNIFLGNHFFSAADNIFRGQIYTLQPSTYLQSKHICAQQYILWSPTHFVVADIFQSKEQIVSGCQLLLIKHQSVRAEPEVI